VQIPTNNIVHKILPKVNKLIVLTYLFIWFILILANSGGTFIMDNGKIKLHNIDFDDFINAIDDCKGDVYLETADGDVLNLKSKLCQMIGLSTILKSTEVSEATVRCVNKEDESKLFRFNLYGKMPEEEN